MTKLLDNVTIDEVRPSPGEFSSEDWCFIQLGGLDGTLILTRRSLGRLIASLELNSDFPVPRSGDGWTLTPKYMQDFNGNLADPTVQLEIGFRGLYIRFSLTSKECRELSERLIKELSSH